MSAITTHVLDTASGRPAAGVPVTLERHQDGDWIEIARGETNADGRIADWLSSEPVDRGTYRITFDTGSYFKSRQETGFYPFVPVVFAITSPEEHHHVPLLLNPFGYSTYRGS